MFKGFAFFSLMVAMVGGGMPVQAQESYPYSSDGSAQLGILPGLQGAQSGSFPDEPCTQADDDQPPPVGGDQQDDIYVDDKTGLMGIVKDGKPSTPAEYDDVQPFADHVYVARKKGCFGLVADDGRTLLPFEFSSIEFKTFDEGDHAGSEITLDAVRPDGQFLYRVDTKKGQLKTSAGPYQYVSALRTSDQPASYAIFDKASPGPVGIIRRDLTIVVPAQYKQLGWMGFAGSRAYWIGINSPVEHSATATDKAVWSVDVFDMDGHSLPPLHAYALWPLQYFLGHGGYGAVALMDDGLCTYFDGEWHAFERAQPHDGHCGNMDRMFRVFLSRNAKGHSVIWATVPTAPHLRLDTEEGQKAMAHGDYSWKKGYEGAFDVVMKSPNEDFLVIRLSDAADNGALKLLDRYGADTGGVYDTVKSTCGAIYLTRGTQAYKVDGDAGGVVPAKAIPSTSCASL